MQNFKLIGMRNVLATPKVGTVPVKTVIFIMGWWNQYYEMGRRRRAAIFPLNPDYCETREICEQPEQTKHEVCPEKLPQHYWAKRCDGKIEYCHKQGMPAILPAISTVTVFLGIVLLCLQGIWIFSRIGYNINSYYKPSGHIIMQSPAFIIKTWSAVL